MCPFSKIRYLSDKVVEFALLSLGLNELDILFALLLLHLLLRPLQLLLLALRLAPVRLIDRLKQHFYMSNIAKTVHSDRKGFNIES